MNIQMITGPLIGGLIGLITNGIAIKMLFRPLKPIYIGKFRLPFTPGLIPKEKPRIAKAIGEIVSRDLLDRDTLRSTLLTDSMREQLFEKIDGMLSRHTETEDTISIIIESFIPKDTIDDKLQKAEKTLAATITKKAIEQDIGKTIVDYAYEEIISKTKPILKGLTSSALNSVKQPFAGKINGMIEEKSGPIVEKFIAEQADELLRMPIKDIIEKYQDKIPEFKLGFWNVYENVINNKLEDILNTVNISDVIHKKINELDLLELEKIIMSLMKNELNALVWLGGLLGIIMGFINVIIGLLK